MGDVKNEAERFLDLVENTSEIVQSVDGKGTFVYVNKTWMKKLGYTKKEAFGMTFPDIIKRDLLNHCMRLFQELRRGKSIKEIETIFVSKKGDEILVKGSVIPRFVDGKFVETQGVFRDITNSKEESSRYKTLYDSSKDAIMVLEPPMWNFTSGNKSTIKLFDCKDEKEFISFTPGDLSPKNQPDGELSSNKAKRMIMKAIKDGSNYFEWQHLTSKKKTFLAGVLLTKFEKGGQQVLQATVRDITEKKKLNESLIKNSQELEKFNQFAVNRELRMIELKKEINSLLKQIGRTPKYKEFQDE